MLPNKIKFIAKIDFINVPNYKSFERKLKSILIRFCIGTLLCSSIAMLPIFSLPIQRHGYNKPHAKDIILIYYYIFSFSFTLFFIFVGWHNLF